MDIKKNPSETHLYTVSMSPKRGIYLINVFPRKEKYFKSVLRYRIVTLFAYVYTHVDILGIHWIAISFICVTCLLKGIILFSWTLIALSSIRKFWFSMLLCKQDKVIGYWNGGRCSSWPSSLSCKQQLSAYGFLSPLFQQEGQDVWVGVSSFRHLTSPLRAPQELWDWSGLRLVLLGSSASTCFITRHRSR